MEWTVTWNIKKKSIIAISHLPQDGSVHSLLRHQFFEPKNSFFFQVISTALINLDPPS